MKSLADFIEVIKRSNLLSLDELEKWIAEYYQSLGGDNSASVSGLSNHLVNAGVLTAWQCDKLRQGKHRGFSVGQYILTDLLEIGCEANKYSAIQVTDGKRVVLSVSFDENKQMMVKRIN